MSTFTEEDIPAFIYLIDKIEERGFEDIKNKPKKIADDGAYDDVTIAERTIRRIYNLRTNLKEGKIEEPDYTKPTRQALNVLTNFYFKKEPFNIVRFDVFKEENETEINKYYLGENKPTDAILKKIFVKQPPKIKYLKNREEKLTALLNELNGLSLEDFVNFWIDEKLKASKNKI